MSGLAERLGVTPDAPVFTVPGAAEPQSLTDALRVLDKETGELGAPAKYLALCFSASYCKSCAKFMPELEYAWSKADMEGKLGCKVLLVGGDRSAEKYHAYRAKYAGRFLALADFDQNLALKDRLREEWAISTIPHVVLLDAETGAVARDNVRFQVEADCLCKGFPWAGKEGIVAVDMPSGKEVAKAAPGPIGDMTKTWTLHERLFGKDKWYDLGFRTNPASPEKLYMDENAVRARAGLLHITSWLAIINIFFWMEPAMLYVLWPLVSWDMFSAATFSVVPLSPYGFLGTILAHLFGPAQPHWKPAEPKRFAWIIGFCLVQLCAWGFVLKSRPMMMIAAFGCAGATWAESALGFCVGCWMWNSLIVPHLAKGQACEECKL